jgi:hypothetical protein
VIEPVLSYILFLLLLGSCKFGSSQKPDPPGSALLKEMLMEQELPNHQK